MSTVRPVSTAAGFFNHKGPLVVANVEPPKFPVYVGHEADSGFRAVAAALIDSVLANPQAHRALVARLLRRHHEYFPAPQPASPLLRAEERLITQTRTLPALARLVRDMAYTLRQVAVDELCANPEYYREAFVGQHDKHLPALMRQSTTRLGDYAMAAMANGLHIPIAVREVSIGKDLPRLQYYGSVNREDDAFADMLCLQLQQNCYLASVRCPARFKPVGELRLAVCQPNPHKISSDPELSDIQNRISREDERLIKSFNQHVRRLSIMMAAGELVREQLLSTYIKSVGHDGQSRHAGVAQGTQSFFEDVFQHAKPVSFHLLTPERISHDAQLNKELIHALARAISIGQLDDGLVYEQINECAPCA